MTPDDHALAAELRRAGEAWCGVTESVALFHALAAAGRHHEAEQARLAAAANFEACLDTFARAYRATAPG
jgi:hypothetical protein